MVRVKAMSSTGFFWAGVKEELFVVAVRVFPTREGGKGIANSSFELTSGPVAVVVVVAVAVAVATGVAEARGVVVVVTVVAGDEAVGVTGAPEMRAASCSVLSWVGLAGLKTSVLSPLSFVGCEGSSSTLLRSAESVESVAGVEVSALVESATGEVLSVDASTAFTAEEAT